jgi:DNA-binding transcriptional LysR family regulator
MTADFDVGLLRAFVASARGGSISRAAAGLGRTQPGVSQQLRRLEALLGCALLRRAPSGVSLTEAGEAFLPYAERIVALSAEAFASTGRGRTFTGRCGVGLIEDLASASLPSVLADFARLHPGTVLEVMTGPGPAMREAWETGRIQLAFCDTDYFPQPPRWSAQFPLVWATGPRMDLSTDPLPLVLFSQPCNWRAPVLAALDAAGRRWRVAFESTGVSGVQAAVRAGLGVAALLPEAVGPGMTARGSAEGLPTLPSVELGLMRRPGSEGDPLVDAVEVLLKRLTGPASPGY